MTSPRFSNSPRLSSYQPTGLVAFCADPTVVAKIREQVSAPWLQLVHVEASKVPEFLSEPRLAALWVDASTPGGRNLLASTKSLEPHLPLLWSGDREQILETEADGYLAHVDFGARAEIELLRLCQSRVYTRETLLRISDGVKTCAIEHGATQPRMSYFYKSNRASLGGVNAALVLEGEAIETIVVSGDPPGLRSLYRRAVPHHSATLAALHDFVGEFANRLGGQLLAFSKRSTPRGTPVLFRGLDSNLRALRGKPSVVVCIEWADYTLYVQLVIRAPLASGRIGISHPGGSVRFL